MQEHIHSFQYDIKEQKVIEPIEADFDNKFSLTMKPT